jgi:glycerophosphoryl diester phosphodiesterase
LSAAPSVFGAAGPRVFAHRGGAALAPENTIAAFDRAAALGVHGIELDVRLSRDGVVVVHHDATLERTTNLRGLVEQHTVAELARADAGFNFQSDEGRPYREVGVTIPTLEAVLRRYPHLPVIVELKVNHPEMAASVLAVVRKVDAADRVCIGAFGLRVLRAVRGQAPMLATSAAREEVRWALYRSWVRWPCKRVAYNGYQVPEVAGRTRVVSPRFVDDAHRAGLPVQVWTVNTPEQANRLLRWNVDALITDRPDVILPLVQAANTPN